MALTGVRNDSATKRALAFNYGHVSTVHDQTAYGFSHEELHLRNLLVYLLHELDYEVDQLVLQHLLSVEVGDQERDIISLPTISRRIHQCLSSFSYLDRLPPQNKERFRSLRQKPRKLVHQNMLDLIRLLDFDTDTNRVD